MLQSGHARAPGLPDETVAGVDAPTLAELECMGVTQEQIQAAARAGIDAGLLLEVLLFAIAASPQDVGVTVCHQLELMGFSRAQTAAAEAEEDEEADEPALGVVVTTLGGNFYNLAVRGTDTVRSVKSKMEALIGSPVDDQRLFLDEVELRDGRTLSSFANFQDGATFSVVYGSQRLALRIEAMERGGQGGQTVRVEAMERATIEEVKEAAMQELGMTPRVHAMGGMRILFGGKPCEDHLTLLDYLIGNEALLQLTYVGHGRRRF